MAAASAVADDWSFAESAAIAAGSFAAAAIWAASPWMSVTADSSTVVFCSTCAARASSSADIFLSPRNISSNLDAIGCNAWVNVSSIHSLSLLLNPNPNKFIFQVSLGTRGGIRTHTIPPLKRVPPAIALLGPDQNGSDFIPFSFCNSRSIVTDGMTTRL